MSFIKHDYKCDDCALYVQDEFVRRSEMYEHPCPECGENMKILPCKMNIDWDTLAMGANASPEAIRHWEKKRAQQQAKEEKSQREHGDYGPRPGAD